MNGAYGEVSDLQRSGKKMNHLAPYLSLSLTLPAWLLGTADPVRGEISANLLCNPSFEEGAEAYGVPRGWSLYAGNGQDQHLRLVELADTGKVALLIEDNDPGAEIGIHQTVPAQPNLTYEAKARVRAVEGFPTGGCYLQLRFLPSNQYAQASLAAGSSQDFETVSVRATAPPDTQEAIIYLYTHRDPTPHVIVDSVQLISGVEPPLPPPPEPIPPIYTQLKELYLTTDLVKEGRPHITILIPASGLYNEQAARLQQAIAALTGVRVPIATDDSPAGSLPLQGHLIALGNRSTNRTIGELYNLYYTILDLRYPGPGGYVVRTLHNPFGNGCNVIFVGGSDPTGIEAGTEVLIAKLRSAGAQPGTLRIGWLAEIKLGQGITVPTDLRQFETWEASAGYGSVGYFGWNSLSKRLAMYYLTGDEFQAREFIRLAFPDAQAFQEITEIDEERIENKQDPLAGPYHYNAHLMILFWDLVEESPVFTDAERLRVTNAFARQLNHRREEGVYGLTAPPAGVGSRHGQWSALSLYCLGRYFQKDYPNPIWQHCVEASKLYFASLQEHSWLHGESDNLFWYNTALAPILTYMVLTGDRKPLENGVLSELLRGQEILISGRQPDWALKYAALDYLHKAAYLTQDGRWLTYRDRTGLPLDRFRLGQSFWPEEHLQPVPPEDLVGRWSIQFLPRPAWRERNTGFKPEESFYFASFRSAPDAAGDFILLDGFNGASRNPYHTFAILELRLGGRTLLGPQSYRNQVLTKADGMVEPQVAMDAALRYAEVVGETATAIGEVPQAAFCNWRRILAQRIGRYALIVDDLTFRTDSDNMEVQILWEGAGSWRADPDGGTLRLEEAVPPAVPPGWKSLRALDLPCTSGPADPTMMVRLESIGILLLRATEPGAWLEMPFQLAEPVQGELFVDFINYVDRGLVRVFLDGRSVGEEYDHYATSATPGRLLLGRYDLAPGDHRLRVEVVARHPGVEKCYIGLAGLSIRPAGAPPAPLPPAFQIQLCDAVPTAFQGRVGTMQWQGSVRKGEHCLFFSLLAPFPADGVGRACVRLAANAAAVALPEPALAVVGSYQGVQAGLAVLAEDHLYGHRLTQAALEGETVPLLTADAPIDVDWDFTAGVLWVVNPQPVNLGLRLSSPDLVKLDGQPLTGERKGKERTVWSLPAGRHRMEGVSLEPLMRQRMRRSLVALLAAGNREQTRQKAAVSTESQPPVPVLSPEWTAQVGGRVVDLTAIPSEEGTWICVAAGPTVHVLSLQGKEVRTFQADGNIRVLRWWPEPGLLLVGCADEKVIAFDLEGNRKWVFVSEMDPAVFQAAKQYWFKSAPGHEGIHGLYTGVFLEGKSQAFVGSACTLEILDENGQLVKRLPVFWGPGSKFELIDGPAGSTNLLIAREPTDSHALAVLNNRTLDPSPRSFYDVPAGHTYVGGWACMSRDHLFYDDLDGDGEKELTSEINGAWNRVTVWNREGRALYNAQFGAGDSIPARNIRDLDIADLDGDGRKEILVAHSSGLVVALDCRCRKVWSKRLASPPTVLKAVMPLRNPAAGGEPGSAIFVGCEDGSVMVLDGQGHLVRQGQVAGRPTCLHSFRGAHGSVVVLATDQGEVRGFRGEL